MLPFSSLCMYWRSFKRILANSLWLMDKCSRSFFKRAPNFMLNSCLSIPLQYGNTVGKKYHNIIQQTIFLHRLAYQLANCCGYSRKPGFQTE